MTEKEFRIVIVGGGIAGLSAAIALRKDNRHILVLEQSSLNREIGATISLQPNASKIIEQQWGLEDALKKKGSMVDEAFQIFNLDGELQMKIPLLTKDKYGSERVMFHRQDLHDVLKERATSAAFPGKPATIKVSSRVITCDCEAGKLTLENGETISGDVIVGADGIKSIVRQYVLGGQDIPVLPTGFSAYRMVISTEDLAKEQDFSSVINPRHSLTTMVLGHDRRLIMGPARNASIYSIVAMVPDENMHESSGKSTWNTKGDSEKMLETFKDFPEWAKKPLRLASDLGLWQLRDIDPLPTWYRGRTILIGDAAHAMLPTQGQGASQSVEDAEALGAFFANVEKDSNVSLAAIANINRTIFECRYDRASLIQGYSRQAARPATDPGSVKIKMSPADFMDYNCSYDGALNWHQRQQALKSSEKETGLEQLLQATKIAVA